MDETSPQEEAEDEASIKEVTISDASDENKVRYIYHFADIHIRLYARHKEYKEVFENLYECLRNAKPGIVVICGDILHSKNELSPNCIELASDLFRTVSGIMPTFVILGNHDLNHGNKNHLDALTPIINNLNLENLHYLRETGIYHYANITFGVTSIINGNKLLKASEIENPRDYKIALYHGQVNNCETDVGVRLNSELSAEDFEGYDYALLGDVHKFQYMNEEKTICYSSSLICQNFGETVENHGIVVWDIKKGTSELVEIPNDYGYCTVNIEAGELVEKEIPKKPRLRFIINNTEPMAVSGILKKMRKKYKVQEVIKTYTTSVISERDEISVTTTTIKGQNTLLREELTKNLKLSEDDIDRIIKINKKYNRLIEQDDTSEHHKGLKWELNRLVFSNMFSYGENNVIDFSEKNVVIGIVAFNGYGKSSIIDALLFSLFDRCSRGEKKQDIVNIDCEKFACQVEFSIGNYNYVVCRRGFRNKKSLTVHVKFWRYPQDDHEAKEDLTGKDRTETNKTVQQYIGKYEDFITTCVSLQNNHNSFTDLTQSKRKEFLQQLLRIGIYEDLHRRANEKKKALVANIKLLEKQYSETDRDKIELEIDEVKRVIDKKRKTLMKREDELEEANKQSLKKEKRLVKLVGSDQIDALAKESVSDLKCKRKLLSKSLKTTRLSIASLEDELPEMDKQIEEAINYEGEITVDVIETEIQTKQEKIERLLQKRSVIPEGVTIEELYKDIAKNSEKMELLYQESAKLVDELRRLRNRLNEQREEWLGLGNVEEKIRSKTNKERVLNKFLQEEKQLEERVKTYNKLIAQLDNHEYDPDCKYCVKNEFVQDAMKAQKKLVTVEEKLKLLRESIDLERGSLDEIHDIDETYKHWLELDKECKSVAARIDTASDRLLSVDSAIQSLTDKDVRICKRLKQWVGFLDEEQRNIDIERKIAATKDEIGILKDVKKLCERRDKIKNSDIVKLQKKLLEIENDLHAVNEKLDNSDSLEAQKELYEELQELKENKVELEESVKELRKKISDKETQLGILQNNLKAADKKEEEMEDLKKKLLLYKSYVETMGKDGIPNTLLAKFIPEVESQVNNILSMLYDFTVSLKGDDGNIEFYVIKDGKEPYSAQTASGFEKFIMNVCIRVVFSKLSTLAKPNVLIIDEMLAAMDSQNKNNIDTLFQYLKTQFDTIVIISHLEDLKGSVDRLVNIQKLDSFSSVNNLPADTDPDEWCIKLESSGGKKKRKKKEEVVDV